MMEYQIIDDKSIYNLQKEINEWAKRGWRLVNCWSVVQGMYEKHYAAMEKPL